MFACHRGHSICPAALGASPFVLDLGANRGAFAAEMTDRYGARCVLVEANPELARALGATHARVIHCAVSARSGVVPFHIAKNDEASSVLTLPTTSSVDAVLVETVEVTARTLDDLLAELPPLDVLKLDIEGAEVDVLLTASPSALQSVGQITVEFHCEDVFGFGGRENVERVVKRLTSLGFQAIDFTYPTRIDVLFVNRARQRIPSTARWRAEWPGRRHEIGKRLPWLASRARWLRRRIKRESAGTLRSSAEIKSP